MMKKRGQDKRINKSMFSVRSFFIFFLTISAPVSFSFLMFIKTSDIEFGMEIQKSAFLTFLIF